MAFLFCLKLRLNSYKSVQLRQITNVIKSIFLKRKGVGQWHDHQN